MHPIERLRYVARAGSAPDHQLVAETVPAIGSFAGNSRALLVAVRQLIHRQPDSTGLLILGARVLLADDPIEAGWRWADELEADRTEVRASDLAVTTLPGSVNRHVISTIATGPDRALCPAGTSSWLDHADGEEATTIGVTPLGTRLPRLLWQGYLDRNRISATTTYELIELDRFGSLLGPEGDLQTAWSADCADVAELVSF